VLNAVIYKVYDEARKIAKEQPAPGSGGAFQGVPFLLKDILAEWKPAPTASGCRFFAGASASFDAELVVRYLRAGLIPLGRTNAPELGILPTTEPQFYGPCHNPWIVPVAHANDGGGSIRIPAACCGLVGLKPTRGRNPLGPIFGDLMDGLVSEHVVSRTVRDSAAMLDCTAGPDVGDPYWAPPPERPYLEEVSRDPGRRRLAYTSRTFTDKPVHPDCVAAMEKTARLCQGLGHEVEDASPPVDMDQVGGALRVLFTSNAMASINLMAFATGRKPSPEFFEPLTWALYEEGKETSGAQYQIAVTVMQMASRKIAAFFEDYDAWISPTLGAPPAPLGTIDANETNLDKAIETLLDYVPFTPVFNMTGQPAVSLPLHANDDGLPIGVHVVGRFGDEGLLYRLSGQLEKECPWIDRKPPIWD
jgi:amidase